MLNEIIRYFDLQSASRGTASGYSAAAMRVFQQYAALVLGIAVQPFLAEFQVLHHWNINLAEWLNWFLFALITGLLIFPGVYKQAFDANQPKFVQFCAIFASGIGWKSLLTTAGKAAVSGG
jgi:hypothetical protein